MTDSPAKDTGTGAALGVWVVPGSSRSEIAGMHAGLVKVRVTSHAQGGKANREVIRVLSAALGENVSLTRGITARQKVFQVSGVDADFIVRKLGLDL